MNASLKYLFSLCRFTSYICSTGREVDPMTRASLVARLASDLRLLRDTVTREIRVSNAADHTVAMMFLRAQVPILDRTAIPFRPTVTTSEKGPAVRLLGIIP